MGCRDDVGAGPTTRKAARDGRPDTQANYRGRPTRATTSASERRRSRNQCARTQARRTRPYRPQSPDRRRHGHQGDAPQAAKQQPPPSTVRTGRPISLAIPRTAAPARNRCAINDFSDSDNLTIINLQSTQPSRRRVLHRPVEITAHRGRSLLGGTADVAWGLWPLLPTDPWGASRADRRVGGEVPTHPRAATAGSCLGRVGGAGGVPCSCGVGFSGVELGPCPSGAWRWCVSRMVASSPVSTTGSQPLRYPAGTTSAGCEPGATWWTTGWTMTGRCSSPGTATRLMIGGAS